MRHPAPAPSPVRALGAALFDSGLRVREEYDELILIQRDFELRFNAIDKPGGATLRCFVSVAENRIAGGSLVLFHEIAVEGHPVVAFGAGRGRVTFEFAWFHPDGADWRISAERCQGLVDRVVGALAPLPVARRETHRPDPRRQSLAAGPRSPSHA